VTKIAKMKLQKVASMPKRVSHSKAKVIDKDTPPKELAYMKAPPNSSVSCPAICLALRQSVCIPKPKKCD
jgi:hypothetical protein